MVVVVVVMMAVSVSVAMPMVVIMPAVAARIGGERLSGLLTGKKILHRLDGVILFGPHRGDAARRYVLGKAGAEPLRQQNLDAVDRVRSAAEFVDHLFLGQRNPLDLDRLAAGLRFEDQKAAGMSGMTGHITEILARHGNAHDGSS